MGFDGSAARLPTPRPPFATHIERALDFLGLLLVALLALWGAFFAGGGHGRPGPVLWLLGGLVVAFIAGRVLSARPGLVPRLVAAGVAGAFAFTWPGALSSGGAPTGYANSNATLAALGVISALAAARHAPVSSDRHGWLLLAGLLFACALLTESVAGVLSLLLALALLFLATLVKWPPLAPVGGLIALSLLLGITGLVASGRNVAGVDDVRRDLWEVAAELVREEPLHGIGPGRFAERHQVSDDEDLRWAHHEYLQVAAEQGVVGLSGVLLLIAWICVRLMAVPGGSAGPVIGAVATLLVAFHATVDHVGHTAVVLLVALTLAGAGSRGPTRSTGRPANPLRLRRVVAEPPDRPQQGALHPRRR